MPKMNVALVCSAINANRTKYNYSYKSFYVAISSSRALSLRVRLLSGKCNANWAEINLHPSLRNTINRVLKFNKRLDDL